MPEEPFNLKRLPEKPILGVILAVAALLRFWNINWGLPDLFEEAFPLRIAIQFWNQGGSGFDFNPHFYNYPGLMFYLTFLVQGIVFGGGFLSGVYSGSGAFLSEPGRLVIISRTIAVLFDVGSVWIVYLICRRIADHRTGLIGAGILALNPVLIEAAHQVTVDIPLAFFTSITLYFLVCLVTENKGKWYTLSGIGIGLAAATKYTGAFLLVILFLAHFLASRNTSGGVVKTGWKDLLRATVLASVVFICFNPYIILSFQEFRKDIEYEQFHMSYGHLGIDPGESTIGFYVFGSLPKAFGWILLTVTAGSILFHIFRRRAVTSILLAFILVTIIILASWAMRADRYIIPLFPVLTVFCALGFTRIPWKQTRILRIASPLLLGIAAIPLFLNDLSYNGSLGLPDTRSMTRTWIEKTIPTGAAIATGPAGVVFPKGKYTEFEIPFTPTESEYLYPFYDTRWYEDLDLVIATNVDYARFVREPDRYRRLLAYFDTLHSHWSLVYQATGDSLHRGPTIWLYRFLSQGRTDYFPPVMFRELGIIADTGLTVSFTERLAYAHFMKGRFRKSSQLLETAAALEPGNIRILRELIWTTYKLDNYDEVIRLSGRSLSIDPRQAEITGLLGGAYLRTGRPAEAERYLRSSLEMNSRLETSYLDLELLYRNQHDTGKQKDILQRYLAILPPESENAKLTRDRIRQLEQKQ